MASSDVFMLAGRPDGLDPGLSCPIEGWNTHCPLRQQTQKFRAQVYLGVKTRES